MPRGVAVKSQEVRTEEQDLPQPEPRVVKGEGKDKAVATPLTVEGTERVAPANRIDAEWVANMNFARELVTIRVDESTDENAEKQVEVWNNGDMMIFPRGKEVTCERRFVETLMRAKPTRYTQKPVLDEFGKPGGYQEIPHRALRYNFSVVRDDSKYAQAWLKATLAQG